MFGKHFTHWAISPQPTPLCVCARVLCIYTCAYAVGRRQLWVSCCVVLYLFFKLLMIFFVDFTLCTPIHSSTVPLYLLLQPPKRQAQKKNVTEAVVCHSQSHSILFNPYIFICKYSLQRVVNLAQDLWLLHYQD